MCVLRMVIYFDKFDSSFQGTWTTYGNLTTSFTLCTAWRDCATSRSRPVWICLFCVQSLIKSWISCYIIYMSQILNKSALYVDFNYSWRGKLNCRQRLLQRKAPTVSRGFLCVIYLVNEQSFECDACSHVIAMQTHDNGSNMFHYIII